MKKLLTAPFLIAIATIVISFDTLAQVRSANPALFQTGGQIRRNNRLPGVRPPLSDPQADRNRPLNPNQIKKQELQRRLMQAIGLTPEQRARMQEIRRNHEDESLAAGRRLRQARQALDRAIMSEPYSESEVHRATEALAAAQADKIRLDASVRARVRGVLTPDQVQRFHQLQREMRQQMQQEREQERDSRPPGPGASGAGRSDEAELVSFLFSMPQQFGSPTLLASAATTRARFGQY
jgi:Spy/CpxP family protein refolding chaperone